MFLSSKQEQSIDWRIHKRLRLIYSRNAIFSVSKWRTLKTDADQITWFRLARRYQRTIHLWGRKSSFSEHQREVRWVSSLSFKDFCPGFLLLLVVSWISWSVHLYSGKWRARFVPMTEEKKEKSIRYSARRNLSFVCMAHTGDFEVIDPTDVDWLSFGIHWLVIVSRAYECEVTGTGKKVQRAVKFSRFCIIFIRPSWSSVRSWSSPLCCPL